MKTLYLECNMGAAGDMLMSALMELLPEPQEFIERLNRLNIPNVTVSAQKAVKCGITGTHISVTVSGCEESENMHCHHHEHHHSGMMDIENIINNLDISVNVRDDALAVYKLIAEAESHVHGCEIDNIHFHEVGTMDAVTDIVGVCMLIEELAPDRIIASPVHVGSGEVKCAHGILPVPAPATAYILRGVPIYGGEVRGELCTPTGAAILKRFASEFRSMPVMKVSKIGYGMGSKDFDTANCVRAMLGETEEKTDTIVELCCNLDDTTGEEIGFAVSCLFDAGALDVYTIPIGMKKNRPGTILACICRENQRDEMLRLIFKHTSTIGVREHISNRYTLHRKEISLQTNYGEVRAKVSDGFGVHRLKAEYEDLAEIARKNGISISDIELPQT